MNKDQRLSEIITLIEDARKMVYSPDLIPQKSVIQRTKTFLDNEFVANRADYWWGEIGNEKWISMDFAYINGHCTEAAHQASSEKDVNLKYILVQLPEICDEAGKAAKAGYATICEIAQRKPYYAVFRDSSFGSDSAMVNFEQVFNTYSPSTIRRVL